MRKSIYRFLLINIVIVTFVLTFITYYILRIVDKDKVSQIADTRLDHIIDTLESRNKDFEGLLNQLGDDSISKAQAVSIIINQSPKIYSDMAGIEKLRSALNIQEIVVTDGDGIIVAASRPDIGRSIKSMDIYNVFTPAIENKSYTKVIRQQENNKLFQYAAVSRLDSKGVVIICDNSEFFENSVSDFGISSLFENEAFIRYGHMAVINKETWLYQANTDISLVGKTVEFFESDFEDNIIEGNMINDKGNFRTKYLGKNSVVFFKEYKNYYVLVQISEQEMYANSNFVVVGILISLLIISITVILSVRTELIKNSIE